MQVHLIDGTYELFRHFYALPSARDQDGRDVAAVRGVLRSVLGMIDGGATHVAVATDHVIESFRNGLWLGYKIGEGIAPRHMHGPANRCACRKMSRQKTGMDHAASGKSAPAASSQQLPGRRNTRSRLSA